jgi:hypothetical protein
MEKAMRVNVKILLEQEVSKVGVGNFNACTCRKPLYQCYNDFDNMLGEFRASDATIDEQHKISVELP